MLLGRIINDYLPSRDQSEIKSLSGCAYSEQNVNLSEFAAPEMKQY